MKKILQLLSVVSISTSSVSLAVSCYTNPRFENLPDDFNIQVNDTGSEVELKIQQTFNSYGISIQRDEYKIYLIVDNQEEELRKDYVVKNKDTFLIKILDQSKVKYYNLEFVVTDSRFSLTELSIQIPREISLESFLKKVNEYLISKTDLVEINIDYKVYINNVDVSGLDKPLTVVEGDIILISSIPSSTILVDEISYTLKYEKVDLSKLNLFFKQGVSYLSIKEIFNSTIENWEENVFVSVTRNNKNIEFSEEYFTFGGDKFSITANSDSKEYFSEINLVIKAEYYDSLLDSQIFVAGTTLDVLKKEMALQFTSLLEENNIEIKVETSNIEIFSNINANELLEKEQRIEFDLKFFGISLFKQKQTCWIRAIRGQLKFEIKEDPEEWGSYNQFINYVQNEFNKQFLRPSLDVKKEMIFTASWGIDQAKIIDENFDPHIAFPNSENHHFYVSGRYNPDSKYFDKDFETRFLYLKF